MPILSIDLSHQFARGPLWDAGWITTCPAPATLDPTITAVTLSLCAIVMAVWLIGMATGTF